MAGPAAIRCSGCGADYPVLGGVPRMLPGALPARVAETAAAFGWQWNAFPEQLATFRVKLLEWLYPVLPSDFAGRPVLDAGCGKGRHLPLAADFGARHVVGLDLSTAVDVARPLTAHLPTVDIVQGDLLQPPLAEGTFDLTYSIGVIHHLPQPDAAVRSLARRLRAGGTLHVWVYGYEGNAPVRWFVDPLRKQLARHVPRALVRAGTVSLAIALGAAARLWPHLDWLPGLPHRAYLRPLRRYSGRHILTIVYDQLMAPTTHYVKRDDLEAWFRAAGLADIRIRNSRGMSWTATARRA